MHSEVDYELEAELRKERRTVKGEEFDVVTEELNRRIETLQGQLKEITEELHQLRDLAIVVKR